MNPRIAFGEEQAISSRDSCSCGQNNRRYFECSMNPNPEKTCDEQSFRMEEVLKCTEHYPVVEHENMRSYGKEKAQKKGQKSYLEVIGCDLNEHPQLIIVLVYRERISILDILQCHIHVTIAHYRSRKIRVEVGCKHTNHGINEESDQGKK